MNIYDSETIYYALERFLTGERTLIIARELKISQSTIEYWKKDYLGLSLNEIEAKRKSNVFIPKHVNPELKCEKGKKFGKLTAIEFSHMDKNHATNWTFKCDCGKIHTTRLTMVVNGSTRSCGCSKREYHEKAYIAGWLKNKQEKKSFY